MTSENRANLAHPWHTRISNFLVYYCYFYQSAVSSCFASSCVNCAFLHHASSKWVGLLDTGGAREGWEVLALDDKLLVALESQPGAKGEAGATRAKKFVVDKYRLLVRT